MKINQCTSTEFFRDEHVLLDRRKDCSSPCELPEKRWGRNDTPGEFNAGTLVFV